MKRYIVWLLLALGGAIFTAASVINLIGHVTEIQQAAPQLTQNTLWRQLATVSSVRNWTVISLLLEVLSLGLWLEFASAWNRVSPSRVARLRYIMAGAAALLAPCILLTIFALV
ncbi:hypothetical protein [Edaphobacter bradus]|uniref:hypothetical protein n=1 Tax=Edaphobacter bradus TaxID=2259016 RepID=UPI0021DFBDAE|nr:hypothetical protein [Edaphobacter bradus]